MTACAHALLEVVLNASDEPVRLICQCGREWRVLPIEMQIQPVPPTEFHPRRPR